MSSKTPKKLGRPSKFTPEVVDKILGLLAEGESERSIFDNDWAPSWRAWHNYKEDQHALENSPFVHQYERAKDACYRNWESKIIKIATDESRDYLVNEKGRDVGNTTAVLRDRLKIDSYKWIMSKLKPKVYGESIKQEVSGPNGGPVPMINISMHDIDKK